MPNKYNALCTQRNDRLALYDYLAARIKRIKAHVLAEYGSSSPEYMAIKAAWTGLSWSYKKTDVLVRRFLGSVIYFS